MQQVLGQAVFVSEDGFRRCAVEASKSVVEWYSEHCCDGVDQIDLVRL